MSTQVQHVYLIGGDGSPLVKIGTTNNVASRLRSIQNMSPTPLRVLWHTEGGFALESALHERFAKYRKHGEWFDFGQRNPVKIVREAANHLKYLVRDPKPAPRPAPTEPEAPRDGFGGYSRRIGEHPLMIGREFLLDDRMSGFARGIGAYVIGRSQVVPETTFDLSQMAKANGCSQDDLKAAFDELAELGYFRKLDGVWEISDIRHQDGAE